MVWGKALEVFNIFGKWGQGSTIQNGLDFCKDRHKGKVADKLLFQNYTEGCLH